MSAVVEVAPLELLDTLSPPLCDSYNDECSPGGLAEWAMHFSPCGCLFLLCDEHAEDERERQRWVAGHPRRRRGGGDGVCIGCVAHVPPVVVDHWAWTRL